MSETKVNLQLGKIVLKNYKTYKGDVTIDLSLDLQKTITVIHGEMGHGKTTILEAIYWCLYGENRLTNSESDEGMINKDILYNLKVNDFEETLVEIYLYEENELCYKIKRVMEFVKQNESPDLIKNSTIGGRIPAGIALEEKIEFAHLPRGSSDWTSYNNPERTQNVIYDLFPKSLSKYFLFDAELLDNFFDTTYERDSKVKDGIEKISGLPIIENAIIHLNKTSTAIVKSIADVSLEPIKNEIQLLERRINAQDEKIKFEIEKQSKLRTEEETIDAFLRTHNEDTIKNTQKRVEELKKDIQDNQKRLKEHRRKMTDWVLRANTMTRLNESMNKSMKKCNVWEQEGKIPLAVSSLALKNILESNPSRCICGAHLDKGSNERENIEKLLENLIDSPIIQNITTGREIWERLTGVVQQADKTFKELRAGRDELDAIDRDKYHDKKSWEKTYEDINLEDVNKKFQTLKELRNEINNSNQNLGSAKKEKEKAERELEQKNRELKTLLRKDEKHTSQTNRAVLASTLEKIFEKYRNELKEELRNTVASKTTEYFLKLVSRKDDFSEVQIQENYKTLAFDKNHRIKSLSAGQSCCLALSFIAAIRETAEKNYFMLIDSPFHNISQKERVDIAQNLPKFLPQTQITLLVQDQEYTGHAKEDITGEEIPSVRKTLMANGSIWKEYILKTHKEKGDSSHTVIEEVSL